MVKKLLAYVGEYKKDALLSPFFITLESAMEVVIPLLMARLIDYGISPGRMDAVGRFGLFLVVAALVSLSFGVLAGRFAARASAGFARNLRKGMYYKIQEYSFANINKFSTASLITRLTTDVTNVQMAYQMIIRMAVRCPTMLVFSLFMSFSINPRLSLVFVVAIPFLGFGLYLIASRAHVVFEKVFKIYDKLNNVVQENLHNIRVVKSFVREDYEIEKFKSTSRSLYEGFTKAEKILAFNSPLMQSAMYFCTLMVSWFGAKMIVAGDMTTGQLMSLIAYSVQILFSLMALSMVFVMITISRASAERIVEVLEEDNDLPVPANPVREVKNGDIRFENVSFSYTKSKDNLCLTNINLSIKSGEVVGIIGATGSGKTTLVQLIPRLYDATEGTVYVGGVDVRKYDPVVLRDAVSVVLQKNVLFSGTIKDNLRWGNKNATDEEMVHACKVAQADGFIRSFPNGYDTYIEQGGTNVSGGQKQRLCIARSLLKKPKILILDDATSAVDTKTEALIRQALRSELPETTKIIIAQRVTSVMDADKIVVVDGGKIVAVGSHEELLKTCGIYAEVYYSQMKEGNSYGYKQTANA